MTIVTKAPPMRGTISTLTEIDSTMPWARWSIPSTIQCNISDVCVKVENKNLTVYAGDEVIGIPSYGSLRELSSRVGFPVDFVSKLRPELRAEIINDRIAQTADTRFTFTTSPRETIVHNQRVVDPNAATIISNISPGWRGVLAHADVAQTAYNLMKDVYGNVTIKNLNRTDNEMKMRIVSPYDEEITRGGRSVGDLVSLGIDICYQAGIDLMLSLYLERLVCENGMTSSKQEFDWSGKQVGRPQDQLQWIMVGLANVIGEFDNIITHARDMANTEVEGDMNSALFERARAMRMPPRFDDRLIKAFQEEAGTTEWHLLNAFTRLASHGGLPLANSDAIMSSAGNWAKTFDMVNARMPRPLAVSVGAHIIEDIV